MWKTETHLNDVFASFVAVVLAHFLCSLTARLRANPQPTNLRVRTSGTTDIKQRYVL